MLSAESKEEAEEIAKRPKGLLSYIPSSFNNGPISKVFSEASVNVNGQRGISKSLTNEQVQKLIKLAKEKKGQWVNMVYIKAISVVLIINAIFVTLGVLTISITGVDILGVFLMLCGVSIAAIKGSKFLEENKK